MGFFVCRECLMDLAMSLSFPCSLLTAFSALMHTSSFGNGLSEGRKKKISFMLFYTPLHYGLNFNQLT